ncbi:hypothetical protein SAMN05444004_12229 [Jannaschia faecimaris]|uniref:MFS transporter n=1 Tax=Jannaschia faecimaris TaxID=1244108 RepID=A0A1H3U2N8_9RHOB|nr:hypothetical protein [Jannaschia faecimaris]SDZ56612.1 hypothetical protein SAMN05444004_12229 [Jannaschia faecimaris]
MTRWHILAMLFMARIGLALQFQTLGSVGDDLIVAFGLDYAGIGLLIGLFMVPGLFRARPVGFAGRFASDRVLAASGLCVLAIGGLISGAGAESWTIDLGRVLAGCASIFNSPRWLLTGSANAMSILVMSWPFGIAMGQGGHAWLAEAYGWWVPFQVVPPYCIPAAVGLFLFPPTGRFRLFRFR